MSGISQAPSKGACADFQTNEKWRGREALGGQQEEGSKRRDFREARERRRVSSEADGGRSGLLVVGREGRRRETFHRGTFHRGREEERGTGAFYEGEGGEGGEREEVSEIWRMRERRKETKKRKS